MSDKPPPVVGTTTDDVGVSAIDYYSWGHVAMGIMVFILLSLINNVPSMVTNTLIYIIPWWSMILLAIVVAIVWEILENTLLVSIGVKFEGRRDSLANALWDVLFAIIGAIYLWILKGILVNVFGVDNIPLFYVVSLISFGFCLICFGIGYVITKARSS